MFAELSNANVELVLSKATFFDAQKAKYNTWYNNHHLYFLLEGHIKVGDASHYGVELILSLLEAPCIFGNIYLAKSGTTEFATVFSNSATLCCFNRQDFELLLHKIPHLSVRFTQILHIKHLQIKRKYINGILQTAETRLIDYLYGWVSRNGELTNGEITAHNNFTHEDLGQLLDCSRQQVNKMLNELREKGAIRYGRNIITILTKHEVWKRLVNLEKEIAEAGNKNRQLACSQ